MYKSGIKNFFPVPNCIFSLDLTADEIALYIYLMYSEKRTTNKCYPSFRTIGNALKMSRPTVKKYVDMLCGKGLIDVEPTEVYWNGGRKYNGNLEYTILPIQEAVNSYNERQMRIIEKNQKEALLKQRMLEYERLKAISATDL